MRRLTILLVALTALAVVGCDESYNAVNGSNPPQVVVRDDGDKIDNENIERACADLGRSVSRVQYVGNGKTSALVTCGGDR